jgi:3-isopropylmalate dehydratase small subunit
VASKTLEVIRLGERVDTDAIVPGPYLRRTNQEILPHLFENLDPSLAARLGPGRILWAGPSFGIGSSRESAAACLKLAGVEGVIAPSFGWIFYRNAVNVGLRVYRVAEPCPVEDGGQVTLDEEEGWVQAGGQRLAIRNRHGVAMEILRAGGLLAYLKQREATLHAP